MPNRRPKVGKLARKSDCKRLVAALGYRDHVADSHDRVFDLGAGVRRDAALALAAMPQTDGVDIGAALIRSLSDSSCEVRRAVVSSLSARRERRALPALTEAALTWDQPRYGPARDAAVDALVELAEAQTAARLVVMAVNDSEADLELLRDVLTQVVDAGADHARAASDAATLALDTGEGEVCRRAVEILVWLGSDSVETLLSASRQPGHARLPAIRALGELRDLRAAETLSRLLGDGDPDVRQAAALALGGIGDPRVTRPLVDATTDSEYRVREAALDAVHRLGPVAVAGRRTPANNHPPSDNAAHENATTPESATDPATP